MEISINENSKKVMFEEGEASFPNECCGFLYGKKKDGKR